MDLATMERRLEGRHFYITLDIFVADLNRVFNTAKASARGRGSSSWAGGEWWQWWWQWYDWCGRAWWRDGDGRVVGVWVCGVGGG